MRNFLPFFLAVSFFLLTFANAKQDDCVSIQRGDCFAYGFFAAGFFYA